MTTAAVLSQSTGLADRREATIRIIVVDTPAEAEVILGELRRGADFSALAGARSIDPTSAQGGLVGRVQVSSLRPELRAALDGLHEGDPSPVVRVPTGYAIVRIEPEAGSGGPDQSRPQAPGPALAAAGSIRYAMNLSGYVELMASFTATPKADGWNEDPAAICSARNAALERAFDIVNIALAPEKIRASDPFDIVHAYYLRGQLYAYDGRMAEAIAEFERAIALAETRVPHAVPMLNKTLGVAHLHKAELDNGLYHEPGHRCLLFHPDAGPVADTRDLDKTVDYLQKYLVWDATDVEARWLLNIAHIAAGSYPAQVPSHLLIRPEHFDSAEDVGVFVDVAPQAGLLSFASAGGAVIDDFDNDGQFDIVTSTMNACEPMRYFHRAAGGMFEDATRAAGLADQIGGLNAIQADYDNDGCVDILLLRGGWELPQRNSLLRNTCAGTFVDVTREAGLAAPVTATQTAAWADVNNDGLLDLFLGNENSRAQLFVQTAPGRFEDRAAQAGVDRQAFTKAVVAGDYDNDGWIDFYVSNFGTDNFLYRNQGDSTFVEVAREAGVTGPRGTFPAWFFDYDNDGWLDIFAPSYYTSTEESARTYLRLPHNADTMKLYRNLGNGRFEDVTARVGLDRVFMPMGANFGDIDNDGWLDIYMGTGNPSYATLLPSVLLRNRESQAFVDVTTSSGTGELHKGHGVAFADFNGDGAQEILFQVGGATPGDAHALRLFENPGHDADWLSLKLVGVRSNTSAYGARIAVTVEHTDGRRRTLHRMVGTGGSFGASPLEQHVGLGTGVARVDVDIWWPASGTRQHFSGVPTNQALRIVEDEQAYTRIARTPLPLGGTPRTASRESNRAE